MCEARSAPGQKEEGMKDAEKVSGRLTYIHEHSALLVICLSVHSPCLPTYYHLSLPLLMREQCA